MAGKQINHETKYANCQEPCSSIGISWWVIVTKIKKNKKIKKPKYAKLLNMILLVAILIIKQPWKWGSCTK